jgi:hypothetical protein
LGDKTHLFFRYKLAGGDSMRLILVDRTAKDTHIIDLNRMKTDKWAEVTADFTGDSKRANGAAKPKGGDRVDEIQFLLPKGAELLLDDVLLYEPDEH